jgi:hypothetical protein
MAEIDDLFQAALGLAEPSQVVRTAFDAEARASWKGSTRWCRRPSVALGGDDLPDRRPT